MSRAARALEAESPDWVAIAADWYERRYGPDPPANPAMDPAASLPRQRWQSFGVDPDAQ